MKIKSQLIIGIILIILLAGAILIYENSPEDPLKQYSTYTKALCDENNLCQDYIIACENNKLVSMNQITGATVQFSKDWEDIRENKTEMLCN